MADDVDGSQDKLPVAKQRDALVCVRRKRGEAAKETDKYECTRVRHQDEALLYRADDATKHGTAHEVDDERAQRKQRAGCAQDEYRQQVARHGSKPAANRYQKKIHVE